MGLLKSDENNSRSQRISYLKSLTRQLTDEEIKESISYGVIIEYVEEYKTE